MSQSNKVDLLSTAITSITRSSRLLQEREPSQEEQLQTDNEWEEARKLYDSIIYKHDAKDIIIEAVKKTKEEILKDPAFPDTKTLNKDEFNIALDDQTYTFINDQIVTIGRLSWNDIILDREGISRCHLIVIPIPERNLILLIDFASIGGSRIEKRSSEKPLSESSSQKKEVMMIDWDEASIVSLSEKASIKRFTFCPRMCIICFENARAVRLNCGHLVSCYSCSNKLDKCPLCKKDISGWNEEKYPMRTMLINN